MASSLNEEKTIDEDLAKYRARAERDQERIDELEARSTHFADELRSSLVVPSAAFAMGYVRGYFGEKASIFGISIDAAAGLLFNGLAALLGFSSNKGAEAAAKVCGDIVHGTLACWTAATGAELGLKKRMELPAPVPAPQPNTGAEEMPQRVPRPMTHEELAAIKADMPQGAPSPLAPEELAAFAAFKSKLAMHERPPAPTQSAAPAQSPAPPVPRTNPLPKAEAVARKAPVPRSPAPQQPPSSTQQSPSAKAEFAPETRSTREKPFRFTQRAQVDGESGLTTLLRSFGIPPVSETTNWPSPEYSIENFDRTLRWARAPA